MILSARNFEHLFVLAYESWLPWVNWFLANQPRKLDKQHVLSQKNQIKYFTNEYLSYLKHIVLTKTSNSDHFWYAGEFMTILMVWLKQNRALDFPLTAMFS